VDRKVIGFDAVPVLLQGVGSRLAADVVWSIAVRAGLVSDLVRSMQSSVEASQEVWERSGLRVPVTIAPVAGHSTGRTLGRRSNRPAGRLTISIDLDPASSHGLYGLRPDRWWRVHVPAEDGLAEIRRIADSGARARAVRLSATLVHRFTRDATQLSLVARCIDGARRSELPVQAEGADDGESVRGLLVLGCHAASGAGLGADLPSEEIPTLRGVSPALRPAADGTLPVAAG